MNDLQSSPNVHDTREGHDWRKKELVLAFSNAIKLGGSLVVTWGIALIARLYIPRHLGPERFGILNFADAFTATAFVVMGLGLDTYVRKEISVRPAHANDFVGGAIALRLLLLVLVYAGMEIVLRSTHSHAEVRHLVYIFGATQFFMVGGATSAGLLQAAGRVNEMSVLSVVAKLGWAGCIVIVIVLHLGLWAYALSVAITEGAKSLILFWLARKHLGFRLRIQYRATCAVVIAALPFFISTVATSIYERLGVNMLEFMTTHREVGWYGAAAGLAGITMLLVPVVAWVLIPLFARSAARSEDELYRVVRRSLEFLLVLAIPVSLMMTLGAELWVSILFGRAFAPAALALRVLAVATVLMYVSIVAYYALAVLNFTWRMSLVSVWGILVNVAINMLLIRRMSAQLGPGGGSAASATATLVTEIAVLTPLLITLGRRAFDRRLVDVSVKSFAAAICVVALDSIFLRPLGPLRLAIDAAVYLALVLVSGAFNFRSILNLAQTAMRQKGEKANGLA